MKKFLALLVTASLIMIAVPGQADDNKKRRISGVKSSQHAERNTERRRDSSRTQRQGDRRTDRRSDRRTDQRRTGNRSAAVRSEHRRHASNNSVNRHRNYGNHGHRSSYRTGNRNHYPRSHHSGYRYSGHHSNRTNYLLGGVLLGAALNSHRHSAHCGHDGYYSSSYPRHSRVVTTRVVREGTYASQDDVHLFRDRDANCYEVTENRHGDEVRSEIDPSYCEW